jgi:hypothetical protein
VAIVGIQEGRTIVRFGLIEIKRIVILEVAAKFNTSRGAVLLG